MYEGIKLMKRILTEEKVLKKLNIEDFRHLTKDKVIGMSSMLDKSLKGDHLWNGCGSEAGKNEKKPSEDRVREPGRNA